MTRQRGQGQRGGGRWRREEEAGKGSGGRAPRRGQAVARWAGGTGGGGRGGAKLGRAA